MYEDCISEGGDAAPIACGQCGCQLRPVPQPLVKVGSVCWVQGKILRERQGTENKSHLPILATNSWQWKLAYRCQQLSKQRLHQHWLSNHLGYTSRHEMASSLITIAAAWRKPRVVMRCVVGKDQKYMWRNGCYYCANGAEPRSAIVVSTIVWLKLGEVWLSNQDSLSITGAKLQTGLGQQSMNMLLALESDRHRVPQLHCTFNGWHRSCHRHFSRATTS